MLKTNHNWRASTLSRSLLAAGLLGAAISGLSAGSAQADQSKRCTFGTYTDSNPTCLADSPTAGWTLGDKIFTMTDFGTLGAPNTSGLLSFIWNDFPPAANVVSPNDIYNVLVDFVPSVAPPATGNYAYTLAIVPPYLAQGYTFNTVELDVNHSGTGQVVTKVVTNLPGSPLISTNGVPAGPSIFNPNTTSIAVTDSWVSASNTGRISSISNVFTQQQTTVPGPLPLLGAGAAFGFSRRIRSRIKGARLV